MIKNRSLKLKLLTYKINIDFLNYKIKRSEYILEDKLRLRFIHRYALQANIFDPYIEHQHNIQNNINRNNEKITEYKTVLNTLKLIQNILSPYLINDLVDIVLLYWLS